MAHGSLHRRGSAATVLPAAAARLRPPPAVHFSLVSLPLWVYISGFKVECKIDINPPSRPLLRASACLLLCTSFLMPKIVVPLKYFYNTGTIYCDQHFSNCQTFSECPSETYGCTIHPELL